MYYKGDDACGGTYCFDAVFYSTKGHSIELLQVFVLFISKDVGLWNGLTPKGCLVAIAGGIVCIPKGDGGGLHMYGGMYVCAFVYTCVGVCVCVQQHITKVRWTR